MDCATSKRLRAFRRVRGRDARAPSQSLDRLRDAFLNRKVLIGTHVLEVANLTVGPRDFNLLDLSAASQAEE